MKQTMKDSTFFENLPEGFRLVEDEIDYKLVALTLTQAFADYAYPVPSCPTSHSSFMKIYYEFSKGWIDNALKYGHVLTNDDYSAVMVLVPMDKTCPLPRQETLDMIEESVGKEVMGNLLDILDYIGKEEETMEFSQGTMYIEALAVQTPRQGQKLASKLMRKLFEECDRENREVILFTNTERNVSIYEHLGFDTYHFAEEKELNSSTFFMKRIPKTPDNR